MELLGTLGSALLGFGTGGIATLLQTGLGALGSYLKKKQELKALAITQAHELLLMDKQKELIAAESDAKIQEARSALEETALIQDGENMRASFQHDTATYSSPGELGFRGVLMAIVDFIRGITRPVMTAFLCVIAWKTFQLMATVTGGVPIDVANEMLPVVINNIIYMSATAVGWWFSSRPPKQRS